MEKKSYSNFIMFSWNYNRLLSSRKVGSKNTISIVSIWYSLCISVFNFHFIYIPITQVLYLLTGALSTHQKFIFERIKSNKKYLNKKCMQLNFYYFQLMYVNFLVNSIKILIKKKFIFLSSKNIVFLFDNFINFKFKSTFIALCLFKMKITFPFFYSNNYNSHDCFKKCWMCATWVVLISLVNVT